MRLQPVPEPREGPYTCLLQRGLLVPCNLLPPRLELGWHGPAQHLGLDKQVSDAQGRRAVTVQVLAAVWAKEQAPQADTIVWHHAPTMTRLHLDGSRQGPVSCHCQPQLTLLPARLHVPMAVTALLGGAALVMRLHHDTLPPQPPAGLVGCCGGCGHMAFTMASAGTKRAATCGSMTHAQHPQQAASTHILSLRPAQKRAHTQLHN